MNQNVTIHAIRLQPGQDLKSAIQEFVTDNGMEAGWILSCVGSLTQYNLRFANQVSGQEGKGFFEIISLNGTVSVQGCHLHIALSEPNGSLTGGHLLNGCTIYTTAEIIIAESHELIFTREIDGSTNWKELQIRKK